MLRKLLMLTLLMTISAPSQAQKWLDDIASIPIQDQGRVMPLDTFAKNVAVKLTGRSRYGDGRGPESFSGRHRIELLCDLVFDPASLRGRELITIENRPFKRAIGLDPQRKFFSPDEIAATQGLADLLNEAAAARAADPDARPTDNQRHAQEVSRALDVFSEFLIGKRLMIVPDPAGGEYAGLGAAQADPGAQPALPAFQAFGRAYLAGEGVDEAAAALRAAIDAVATPEPEVTKAVEAEVFYNRHQPWKLTALAYGLAIIAMGLSPVFLRRTMLVAAGVFIAWGTAEQLLGLGLRTLILGRVPVSNTYEGLLWMGLVAILTGLVAQAVNRKGWYLLAATIAAELSVLFAMLVPLQDQTNTLPAVLRSNYWLIVHVLTIVASYGVLALAAVLGHVYLVKEVLLRKAPAEPSPVAHPLLVQTYRAIQVGVLLLTAGTILGGVWAADSWGRFWGWDPKETWALISIVVYFTLLHARYVRWLKDFGLAVSAIVGFMAIVWTFYGVNYVMASGLHSYGFGSGGEVWVAAWVVAEIVFLAGCKLRQRSLARMAKTDAPAPPSGAAPAAG